LLRMVPVLHEVEETIDPKTSHEVDWKADGLTAADAALGEIMASAEAPENAIALHAAIFDFCFTRILSPAEFVGFSMIARLVAGEQASRRQFTGKSPTVPYVN
jgi:hypothetical protein